MSAVIRTAPARAAGAVPSQRAKALRSIGTSINVRMRTLTEGNVLLLPSGAHVVVRTEFDLYRKGARILLRDLEGAVVRSMRFEPQGWVTQLQLPSQIADGEGTWTIRSGDIVLYPGNAPGHSMVAIRHRHGWARTTAPWVLYSDAEVVLHLREGSAQIIRSSSHRGIRPLSAYPMGSVVACRDRRAIDPTVWLRIDEDYWVSNTRGVTASDLMINYELDRRTYHVVWVPEE